MGNFRLVIVGQSIRNLPRREITLEEEGSAYRTTQQRTASTSTAMKRLGQQPTEAAKKKPPEKQHQKPPRQRHHQAMEIDQPSSQDEDQRNTTGTCRTVPVSVVGSAVQRNPGSPRVGLTNRDAGCAATVTVSPVSYTHLDVYKRQSVS